MRVKKLYRCDLKEMAELLAVGGLLNSADALRVATAAVAESQRRKERRDMKRASRAHTRAIVSVLNVQEPAGKPVNRKEPIS